IIGGLEMVQGPGTQTQQQIPSGQRKTGAPADDLGQFVAAVLGSTEDRWNEIFTQAGQRYRAPRLVIFSGATQSACGFAQSAMGPFYCPPEQAVYLDTTYLPDLQRRIVALPHRRKTHEITHADD